MVTSVFFISIERGGRGGEVCSGGKGHITSKRVGYGEQGEIEETWKGRKMKRKGEREIEEDCEMGEEGSEKGGSRTER